MAPLNHTCNLCVLCQFWNFLLYTMWGQRNVAYVGLRGGYTREYWMIYRLSRGRMIWLLPRPLPLSPSSCLPMCRRSSLLSLLTGRGGGGRGGGSKSYDSEKVSSSINHLILSGSMCLDRKTETEWGSQWLDAFMFLEPNWLWWSISSVTSFFLFF
jgi:hypothetical protein